MTHAELVMLCYKQIPYSSQIAELDLSTADEIRFSWRGTRFRVDDILSVEEVGDGVLICSDLAILMQALLQKGNK